MHILLTGGTGLIGSALIERLRTSHSITVVTRNTDAAKSKLGSDLFYLNSVNDISDIGTFDAVINLAGEPIADKRWTTSQKTKIWESRWGTTASLVAKINESASAPRVFISGSAIGYYGRQGERDVVESTMPHKEFTYEVCSKWEAIANTVTNNRTRVCTLRTGVVLSENGGALGKMALPFKLGVGGTLGTAKQYLSWIHLEDMVSAISHLLHSSDCEGPFNMTAPVPVTNKTFSHALSKALSRPCFFNVPAFVMKIAMGESSDMILEGQKVLPDKLIKSGFSFTYPTVDEALNAVYS